MNAILIICHYLLCPHYVTACLHNGLSRVCFGAILRMQTRFIILDSMLRVQAGKLQGVLLGLSIHKYRVSQKKV